MRLCECGNYIENIKEYYCKKCKKEKWDIWYKKNKDKKLAYGKKYAAKHPDISRKWEKNNPEKRKKASKRWKNKSKEHISKYLKQYKKTLVGIIGHRKSESKRRYGYGSNPMNSFFMGCQEHYIDNTTTVYIPTEMHKACWHRQTLPITMISINYIALFFIMQQNIKELGDF